MQEEIFAENLIDRSIARYVPTKKYALPASL
jgi:hypothetical protein